MNKINNEYYSSDSTGQYIHEINEIPLLSEEEERNLFELLAQGDMTARKKLIEGNLRLVVSIAKKYMNRGLPFLDLVQEGNIGLMEAIDKYDLSKQCRLSTYAYDRIRQKIVRKLAKHGTTISIPSEKYEKLYQYFYLKSVDEKAGKTSSTIEEYAEKLKMSVSKLESLLENQKLVVSMDCLIDGDDDECSRTFGDNFFDFEYSVEEQVDSLQMRLVVQKLLLDCHLKENELATLILKYGMGLKNEGIGEKLGITSEAVRQAAMRALRKLRLSKNIKGLNFYMDFPENAMERIAAYGELYLNPDNRCRNLDMILDREPGVDFECVISIYNYFPFPKDVIDCVIMDDLTEEDRGLLKLVCGEDLENPKESMEITPKIRQRFYGYLLPKMRTLLMTKFKNQEIVTKRKRRSNK